MHLSGIFGADKTYKVLGAKFYVSDLEALFFLFSSMKAFSYLGAAKIEGEFAKGEDFKLHFNSGGIIEGNFLEIIQEKKIVMSWSLSGFGRQDEKNTIVEFDFSVENGMTLLFLKHSNLPTKESKLLKTGEWKKFLEDLDMNLK